MPLQRGEVKDYDFDRMTVEFTMLNDGKVIQCAISSAAMDGLEGTSGVKSDHRVDQFMRLRDVIEERASIRFLEINSQSDRPIVLRSNDFLWDRSNVPLARVEYCGRVPKNSNQQARQERLKKRAVAKSSARI
jgi:hypothetical protein